MIKLADILVEAKQVGKLYHFTSLQNLRTVLKNNKLGVFRSYETDYYISTTRDKNFGLRLRNTKFRHSVPLKVRITLDGDKISENYRIEPVGFHGWYAIESLKDVKEPFNLTSKEKFADFYDSFYKIFRMDKFTPDKKDRNFNERELIRWDKHYTRKYAKLIPIEVIQYLEDNGAKVVINQYNSKQVFFPGVSEPFYLSNILNDTFTVLFHFDRDGKAIYAPDTGIKDEMEERIIVSKNGLTNVKNYIIDISEYDYKTNKYISRKKTSR